MPKLKGEEWKYVIILNENDNATLSQISCIYCDKRFVGGISRIRGHLLADVKSGISKCSKVPYEVQQALEKQQSIRLEEEAKKRRHSALDRATKAESIASDAKKQILLPSMFQNARKDDADKAIARLFYASGIPFAIADSPYFKDAITAVAKCDAHYKAPNRRKISSTMLTDEVDAVDKFIASFKEEVVKHGVTIMSDGWTNVQNRPIINFIAAANNSCIFLNALDTSGEVKKGAFIACEISKSIESYGMENVVQVITDSAPNCVAARNILEHQYPNIVFSPCTAHCLDLLLNDLAKLPWLRDIISDSRNIVKFITTHQYSQACFRNHSNLELLKPGETRFCTNFIMLQRLRTVKDALQDTVTSRAYKNWLSDATYKKKGVSVTSIILNEMYWSSLEIATTICEPIIEIIRLADGIGPCTGKIYWKMLQIDQSIETINLPSAEKSEIRQLVAERWRMLHTDLHAAGFMLDPEYCHHSQHQNEEVTTGFHAMIERIFHDNIQSQVKAVQQHATYRAGQGLFSRPMAIAAANEMSAHSWWMTFGAHVPELQQVAIRVLAQVTSASSCERNWSTFEFIHTKKRNRMKCKTVRDIVFVHANLRLKDNLQNINYKEEIIEWKDQSSSEEDTE